MLGVLLLHSDSAGDPRPSGGTALHYCVLSDEGPPPSVNQVTLRTRWPNQDCAVAATMSCALMRRTPVPAALTLETDEGNMGGGVGIAGLIRGLAICSLAAHAEHATPGPAWVMNPASGPITLPADSTPYLAAAAVGWPEGWWVVVDTGAPAPPLSEDTMNAITIDPATTAQRWYRINPANGHIEHTWWTPGTLTWNSPWQDITQILGGGALADSGIAAATTPSGDAVVLVWRGRDGHSYTAWMTTADDHWNGPLFH